MQPLPSDPQSFVSLIRESMQSGQFVKLSLGNYKGLDPDLKQVFVREVDIRRSRMLGFTFRYRTRDTVKNFEPAAGLAEIATLLNTGFRVVTLFRTDADYMLEYREKGGWHGREQKAVHLAKPDLRHDHVKSRPLADGKPEYLRALGITDAGGTVFKSAQDKYKQINQYIKLLEPLIREAGTIRKVADMGSGKGYLTFALYDYLAHVLGNPAAVTGVEYREDLVDLCNGIAKQAGFSQLQFEQGTIADFDADGTDLLIALHACDTATDDAIFKGIQAGARLIVVAPCCHKEVRRAMEHAKAANAVSFLTRHGIFMERQAEMVTDGLRALLLEYAGYKTRVFEFISDAHTPKNVLIVGVRVKDRSEAEREAIREKINLAMQAFGISQQKLAQLIFSDQRH